MRHPEPGEWMSWLYGEASAAVREDMEAHLAVCPDCSRRVAGWRGTMGCLNALELPQRESRWDSGWTQWMRWAAGVAILAVGYGLGRQGGVSPGEMDRRMEALRGELNQAATVQREAELGRLMEDLVRRVQWEQGEALGALLAAYQTERREEREVFREAWMDLETRMALETARLKNGLANLASGTGTGFEQAQTRLRWLTANLPIAGEENRDLGRSVEGFSKDGQSKTHERKP